MSANNWRTCPACRRECISKRRAEIAKVEAGYGKVSVESYSAQLRLAESMPTCPTSEHFAERYELGIEEDGRFSISYSGKCLACGAAFTFKHETTEPVV